MPMDTSALYFGLLNERRARAERESAAQGRAGQVSLQHMQQRQQDADRELEREAKRAEIANQYSQMTGTPVREEYSQAPQVQQSAEAGRLRGEAYPDMHKASQGLTFAEKLMLQRDRQGGIAAEGARKRVHQSTMQGEELKIKRQKVAATYQALRQKKSAQETYEILEGLGLLEDASIKASILDMLDAETASTISGAGQDMIDRAEASRSGGRVNPGTNDDDLTAKRRKLFGK